MSPHINSYVKDNVKWETYGLTGTLSPFIAFDSSSRVQMVSSHMGQAVCPIGVEQARVMHGLEPQLAEFTFSVVMPVDGIVHSVHKKIQPNVNSKGLTNPLTTVIYRTQKPDGMHPAGRFQHIDIPTVISNHKTFGVETEQHAMVKNLRVGSAIPAGTVLARTPTKLKNGGWSTGIDTMVAYISLPGTIEDGFTVSESYCHNAAPLEIGSRIVSWGKKYYPLNLYGDEHNYKPYPGVGDIIRPDGLIFALREYDEVFDVIGMTPENLMVVDTAHDVCTYGAPGAEVYDVDVNSYLDSKRPATTPMGMEAQPQSYSRHVDAYNKSIQVSYNSMGDLDGKKKNKWSKTNKSSRINLSPDLDNLIVRSMADSPNTVIGALKPLVSGTISRTFKNEPIDEYRVEVKYKKRLTLSKGSKVTDLHGTKGVICAIKPDHEMPVDADGNICHLAIYIRSGISRLNAGQFYECYVNGCSRDISKWIRDPSVENTNKYFPKESQKDKFVYNADGNHTLDSLWETLMKYYNACSPNFSALVRKQYPDVSGKQRHLDSIRTDGVYLIISPDEPHIGPQMLRDIKKCISPCYGKVSFINDCGKRIVTKNNVLIASKHMIVLEKTHIRPMATSSSPTQHHGIIMGSSSSNRDAHPTKQQATRVLGETEMRLFGATMGGEVIAELTDMANSPITHDLVLFSLLEATRPSAIQTLVDRKVHPLGGGRSLSLVRNIFTSSGFDLVDEGPKVFSL